MSEVEPIKVEPQSDELQRLLCDIRAVGDLLLNVNQEELLPDTIGNIGWFIEVSAARAQELL